MASAIGSTLHISPFRFPNITTKNQIVINFDNFSGWYGIKPEEVGLWEESRDSNLPVIHADEWLQPFSSLKEGKCGGKPCIAFTFKSAIQFVVELINKNSAHCSDLRVVPVKCSEGLEREFFEALVHIKTKQPELISVSFGDNDDSWAGSFNENTHWLGVILSGLRDRGHICLHWKTGQDYFVSFI